MSHLHAPRDADESVPYDTVPQGTLHSGACAVVREDRGLKLPRRRTP